MIGYSIVECEQGTEAWLQARCGLVTCSELKTLFMTGRKKTEPSKTRDVYQRKLVGEIITGKPAESYSNAHMERGHEMEQEARDYYNMTSETWAGVKQMGFVKHQTELWGGSPDGVLFGDDGLPKGGLEIKTALPHILVEIIERDTFPPEHYWQCMGLAHLLRTNWWDLIVYWPGMPAFVKRLEYDPSEGRKIDAAVTQFMTETKARADRVRGIL